ncbi:hypothetical protein VTN49DRAFT_2628 [Thermomyces lanuginosus]|uniref:uncharacterized protein n=1 Tax=Thermomyces lanuginosus TaxID=5541 RepID=UPI0037447CAF
MASRILLLTFDAYSTLFRPSRPVPELYASVAHSFGLPPSLVTPDRIQVAFKNAFKAESQAYPNYGRAKVLRGEYGGPRQWWSNVVARCFTEILHDGEHDAVPLPEGLIEALLDLFAGSEGYALYDDVRGFFSALRRYKQDGPFQRVVTGVISNSDDRVPGVLKALGVTVGNVRADQERSSMLLPGFEELDVQSVAAAEQQGDHDVDLVITSYEAGEEKPHRLIFDVTAQQAAKLVEVPESASWTKIHVGDDVEKDYRGALASGWNSILLNRDDHVGDVPADVKAIDSLDKLIPEIEDVIRR